MSPRASRFASVVIDVDSTLCGIEGIDWLALRRGREVAERTARLTDSAMNGEIAFESIYGERLAVIRPTSADIDALAQAYRETLAPGAAQAIAALQASGVRVALVSGGIRQAIVPVARDLSLEGSLSAVDIRFDSNGEYRDFDAASPLTTQHGKLAVVRSLALPRPTLAVGDGATDLAMRDAVDHFAAFTGFVTRDAVVRAANSEVATFDQLLELVRSAPIS